MDPTSVTRWSLPLLLVVFAFVLMVWPLARVYRETGLWATALHRETEPGQRLVGVAFLAVQLTAVAFVVLYAWHGPAAVGVWLQPPALTWLGLGLAACGVVGVAIAQRQMGASFRIGIDDAETALVQSGLFAWVRNPIFSALLVLLAGMFLAVPCVWTLGIWLAAAVTVARQVRLEERHLLTQHGDEYRGYAARVGRFVPGVGRLAREGQGSG
jgi:protein-S-isoprenylcysteine O-methyltransferase Ste14